jgi:hypothetical protein
VSHHICMRRPRGFMSQSPDASSPFGLSDPQQSTPNVGLFAVSSLGARRSSGGRPRPLSAVMRTHSAGSDGASDGGLGADFLLPMMPSYQRPTKASSLGCLHLSAMRVCRCKVSTCRRLVEMGQVTDAGQRAVTLSSGQVNSTTQQTKSACMNTHPTLSGTRA